MDSITHIVVGALIGEVCAGKTLGKRAMLIGAAAQSIPDIDVVASFWLDPADDLMAHRGITHSFLFGVLATLALAFLLRRNRNDSFPLRKWIFFLGSELFCHLFLDAFNNYGVGWFEPFSHYRVSFNALFVVDPFYTLGPVIACLTLVFIGRNNVLRKRIAVAGLVISSVYLGYVLINKTRIDQLACQNFKRQGIGYTRYFTTPSPFNNWLWYTVAEDASGYFAGYYSVFDRKDSITFHYFPRQDSLLDPVKSQNEVQQLLRFSKGFYTAENHSDTLVFNDLRFGQIAGWANPKAGFVFHYYLNKPGGNLMVIQRGRYKDLNAKNLRSLAERIRGN